MAKNLDLVFKLRSDLGAFPFVLAPMASITNAAFRLLMKELGAGLTVSELISATGLTYGGARTLELCRYYEAERPVGLQIFGEDTDVLVKAARIVESLGVNFVDINLGCPVPKVVKKGGGSALLRDPDHLYKLLKALTDSIDIPLTVKMRTGWDAHSINIHENVAAASEAGVAWVAIHGRTRAQAYEGQADWDLMAEVASRAQVPIIGNGDLSTADQALKRLKDSGCAAVMIGRGALRNPFIFDEIRKIYFQDRHEEKSLLEGRYTTLIHRHFELLKEEYGSKEQQIAIQLRKFCTWYSAGFPKASQFRKSLYENMSLSADEVFHLSLEFFGASQLEKSREPLSEDFLMGGHG